MPVDVFLVEDLKTIQSAIEAMLQGLGSYRIVANAPTEAEALEWLEQNPLGWELAIIDLVLEQGSGMGVIRRCRRTAPGAKVVVFSNFVTPGIRQHCLHLGADAAFHKHDDLAAFADWCVALSPPAEPSA